jgi:outer membrane protein assembly factor BamB
VVFFGDMGGNFYVLDSANGKLLWKRALGGAVSGGVITYGAGAGQKVAVATGLQSKIWPTPKATAQVQVFAASPAAP